MFSRIILLTFTVLFSVTACANNPGAKNLELALSPDPQLQKNPPLLAQTPTPTPTNSNIPNIKLPEDFPENIPTYPNATLAETKPINNEQSPDLKIVLTRWESVDPSNLIISFYRNELAAKKWQIIKQPQDDTAGIFTAQNDNLTITIAIKPQTVNTANPNQSQTSTELLITYEKHNSDHPNNTKLGPALPSENPSPEITNKPETLTSQEFTDIDQAPPEWRTHLQDLVDLGVLSIEPKTNQFHPNKIITRREYARWLFNANNAMYPKNPAKQIRLASTNTQPVFRDVLAKDADFAIIQGLAEAGLIPSSLSGDSTTVLFQPDAPLTREQLILWKVPLDTRQPLPTANLEAVKQTWGFQDVGKIETKALKAVLADYQNGENSNIRRVFGYTTLFQPKKAVTRGEAAAALWYFGIQGEGISATEALKGK
ncbi:S-layer homology domain-containing protein [Anabaena sp. FACHB-1237]|uniref:S-layer homology domain-containing protein n=1 Tax=Anabaena sp. FACHB-1237 TaxID=2692769 RepID=UPI0016807D9B|nr:S-layer homology domain-containing protein [Anabaena sp. FACHB-1237]MBD2138555.1 S-layer homology domain-containing protein [Anabaena sp. FACHB-1237]